MKLLPCHANSVCMKSPSTRFALRVSVLTFALLWFDARVSAHAGHDEAPGGEAALGPISITTEARQNLGLKSVEADLRALEKTLLVIGQFEAIPDRTAIVTGRIAGRVSKLPVNEGQMVKKGELVAEVESLQVGNPPPRAEYLSPIEGVVLAREVFVGQGADPNTKLLTLADLSEIYVQARVFEGQVNAVRVGQKVRVRAEANPNEIFDGVIERLAGTLDPETRSLKVWARVANPDLKLRPNMQATITIVTAAGDAVSAVPRSAVLGDAGNLFVFVEADDKGLTFERRSVVTGISDDRFIEIIFGVVPGEKVVVTGNYQLQYVASAKPVPKAGPAKPDEPGSAAEPKPALAPGVAPWAWAAALAASLLLNVILLVRRRRRIASHEGNPSAERASGRPVLSRP